MTTTRLIIEPHADDAFLSLGGHIEQWRKAGDYITIATAFANSKREKEARAYAEAVGAEYLCFRFEESGHPNNPPLVGVERVRSAITASVAGAGQESASIKVYVPLGIKHEEHMLVSAAATDAKYMLKKERAKVYYYMDQPYASMTVNSPEVNDAMAGLVVASYLKPTVHKYKHAPLFKSQAKFFHFNPPAELKHNPELILKDLE